MAIKNGTSGNDFLFGTADGDLIQGLAGDDVLNGSLGNDTLDGGLGRDSVQYSFFGTDDLKLNYSGKFVSDEFGDTDQLISIEAISVFAGSGDDKIVGGWTQDTFFGGEGNDQLSGGDGGDVLIGDAGNDTLDGGACFDFLSGGDGADRIYGGSANDVLEGGRGSDLLDGGSGLDTATYTFSELDKGVVFTAGLGTINDGLGTKDTLKAIEQFSIFGSDFADKLTGYTGNDLLYGGAGSDVLSGGGGDDFLTGDKGSDAINGGGGTDTASYDLSAAKAGVVFTAANGSLKDGLGGTDKLTSIENFSVTGSKYADKITGNTGDDHLFGEAGSDAVRGGAGDDVISGGQGSDILDGGAGLDVALYDFSGRTSGTVFTAGLGKIADGEGGTDTVSNVESFDIFGSAKADKLTGAGGADTVDGGDGNDKLYGGAGDDVIIGGNGTDTLTGNAGKDVFVFGNNSWAACSVPVVDDTVVGSGRDVILDFVRGQDKISLAGADADGGVSGDQAFTFIGGKGFSGDAGEIRFSGGVVRGDLNGDKVADFEIAVNGVASLSASDFLL